jgi:hypothetical protein
MAFAPLAAMMHMPNRKPGEKRMRPLKPATFLIMLCLAGAEAGACDSYADEASLASVLARAVAEARAKASLEAPAAEGTARQARAAKPQDLGGAARRGAGTPALPASSSL